MIEAQWNSGVKSWFAVSAVTAVLVFGAGSAQAAQVAVAGVPECGYDSVSNTFWPIATVSRSASAEGDLRVAVQMRLFNPDDGALHAQLGTGRLDDDGTQHINGAYEVPIDGTTRFRPGGTSTTAPAKFGDGGAGGAALTRDKIYRLTLRVTDFDNLNVFFVDFECRTTALDLVATTASSTIGSGQLGKYGALHAGLDARYPGGWRQLDTLIATGLTEQGRDECEADEGAAAVVPPPHDLSFCWDSTPLFADDSDDPSWCPQGIAGSGEANGAPVPSGSHVLAVTWYDQGGASKCAENPEVGARVTFVETGTGDPRYVHVPLVEPYRPCDSCDVELRPIASHVGGVAWGGEYLYVAETHQGFRVFNLRRFLDTGDAVVLPQIGYYKRPSLAGLRFSYASIDASGPRPALVSGEYFDGGTGRIARWPLTVAKHRLRADGAVVRSLQILQTQGDLLTNLQGVSARGGTYLFTRSRGADEPGTLYRATADGVAEEVGDWVVGPEDLYEDRHNGMVWSLGEHPGKRAVVAVPAAALYGP